MPNKQKRKLICIRCTRGCEIITTLDEYSIESIKDNICKLGNKDDGWLTKYPEHPHHRAANPEGENVEDLPSYPATELTGATIGGPEYHTEFQDVWDRYQLTETGIDYWAGTFFTAVFLAE